MRTPISTLTCRMFPGATLILCLGASAASVQAQELRDQYHQAPRDTVSQEVYDGWKQFNLNCARCHGEDVQGTTIAPHLILSLKPEGPINTKQLFLQTVCAGRPDKGMPSWCALGMEPPTIDKIYAYVKGTERRQTRPGAAGAQTGNLASDPSRNTEYIPEMRMTAVAHARSPPHPGRFHGDRGGGGGRRCFTPRFEADTPAVRLTLDQVKARLAAGTEEKPPGSFQDRPERARPARGGLQAGQSDRGPA